MAQSFSVPSGGGNYTLTSIEMLIGGDISSTDIGSLGVSVWSADASGHPADSLHTLTNPASIAENVAASFTAPAGATLEAGNTYVVVAYNDRDISLVGSDVKWKGTNSDDEDATSITGWTLANGALRRAPASTSWSDRAYAFNLRVNGTAEGDTGICDRTQQVQDEILAVVVDVDECAAVSVASLAGISRLDLDNKGITSLKSGDFAGLTGMTFLKLNGNSLTMLPADVFSGPTALSVIHLHDNQLEMLPENLFDGLTELKCVHFDTKNFSNSRSSSNLGHNRETNRCGSALTRSMKALQASKRWRMEA